MRWTSALRQSVTAVGSSTAPLTLRSTSRLIRPLDGAIPENGDIDFERDFKLWPSFFDAAQSRQLLAMALYKLDKVDSTRRRKRRRGIAQSGAVIGSDLPVHDAAPLQDLFFGEYGFEEGHYDSVIHHYRESLVANLPDISSDSPWPDLTALMKRIYALLPPTGLEGKYPPDSLPPVGTSTHVLHLAPHGDILPHVDNLEASGSVIVGVSLGAERTLRLKEKDGERGWDVRLPSGSLYLQRDSIRYRFEHSILPCSHAASMWYGQALKSGHRLSLMVRDAPTVKDSA